MQEINTAKAQCIEGQALSSESWSCTKFITNRVALSIEEFLMPPLNAGEIPVGKFRNQKLACSNISHALSIVIL
jgi:hypothetical protein